VGLLTFLAGVVDPGRSADCSRRGPKEKGRLQHGEIGPPSMNRLLPEVGVSSDRGEDGCRCAG